MELLSEDLIKIVLAVAAGGLIGLEREFRDKAAGFRTLVFICLGAALFSIFSAKLAGDNDPTRIAAGVVTGVGFLGAGVIMRDGGKVYGLTTAATIWVTAAIGMGIGAGLYWLIGAGLVLVMIVLWVFPLIERKIDAAIEQRTYEISCPYLPQKLQELDALFRQCGLQVREHQQMKVDGLIVFRWEARGTVRAHNDLSSLLVKDDDIRSFRY